MPATGRDGREAAAASLLSLRGVSKSFGPVEALKEVDLELERGEYLGLIGHNGAGKSTLMNILMGVLLPDRGDFRVEGMAVARPHPPDQAPTPGIPYSLLGTYPCPKSSASENSLVSSLS